MSWAWERVESRWWIITRWPTQLLLHFDDALIPYFFLICSPSPRSSDVVKSHLILLTSSDPKAVSSLYTHLSVNFAGFSVHCVVVVKLGLIFAEISSIDWLRDSPIVLSPTSVGLQLAHKLLFCPTWREWGSVAKCPQGQLCFFAHHQVPFVNPDQRKRERLHHFFMLPHTNVVYIEYVAKSDDKLKCMREANFHRFFRGF